MNIRLFALLSLTALIGCSNASAPVPDATGHAATTSDARSKDLSRFSKAYFASGCFWCVEEVFESVRGVEEVISGYSGGAEADPTYEQVGHGLTGHAEAVEVYYDPEVVSFTTLLTVFFDSHDPTTPNRQGPDAGAQYRSIAFYQSPAEETAIRAAIKTYEASGAFGAPIVTQVVAFTKFWPAEDYHQNYVRLHPDEGYVRGVSIPRFERFKAKHPELLK